MMINLLQQAAKIHLFNSLDIQLSVLLAEKDNHLLLLIFALLSAETRAGHVFLFIDRLQPVNLFEGRHPDIAFTFWKMAGSPDNSSIYTAIKQCNAVCDAQEFLNKPLVLSGNKLYFQRMWNDEGTVANFFSCRSLEVVDEQRLATILNRFFKPLNRKDWQKIAVAVAVTSRISIISGGPGTGKTMTVARLLATLVTLSHKKLIIRLAAPTGKAADRLTESLSHELLKLNLSEEEHTDIPTQAQTVHRLLCAKLDSQLFHYNKDNKLLLDVLIIDEASMIAIPIMARLIEAIPKKTRVIFLGDKDQLPSVEVGSILRDLCHFSKCKYSTTRATQLTTITGCDLSNDISDNQTTAQDSTCVLYKNYRFNARSGIGILAAAINQRSVKKIKRIFTQKREDIVFHPITSPEQYEKLIYNAEFYRPYLEMIKEDRDPKEIINTFNRYRVLAALREGKYGVIGLNYKLEKILHREGRIRLPSSSWNKNYVGRPIMITKNNSSLGLFNGAIGIMLENDQKGLQTYFQFPNGIIKRIQPNCLPPHKTAFVMTVHKSQGSEFEHVALVLPPLFTPIVSKELVYTAITRAKKNLTIYADFHVFIKALVNSTVRRSSLNDRLI